MDSNTTEKAVLIDRDSRSEQFSNEQLQSAATMAERGPVTIWYDETDSTMGLQVIEDGLSMLGFFGRDGTIIGDWIV